MNKTYLKIVNILAISTFITLIACDDDDNADLDVPNHRVIYTSEMDFQNRIQVNGDITLGDVSPGVISRTWTFPEGVVDIVDSNNDLTSTKAVVNVIFTQPGEFGVDLHQVFEDDAYVGETLVGKELDTTITVQVLDYVNISVQAYYLNDDDTLGSPLDLTDTAENELEAGKRIRYALETTGGPENIVWTFEGGNPETLNNGDIEVDVTYPQTGVYDFQVIANRDRPFGGDTIAVKALVRVIPPN